jgi:hypothetical protein
MIQRGTRTKGQNYLDSSGVHYVMAYSLALHY